MKRLVSFVKKMTFREYILAICMFVAWVAYLTAFIMEPTKFTFIGGGCIVAICFAFLCWMGEELPTETIWSRFTDIALVSLFVMFVTNLGMAVYLHPSFKQIFSIEFFFLLLALMVIYLFIVIFFVLGIIGFKEKRPQIH